MAVATAPSPLFVLRTAYFVLRDAYFIPQQTHSPRRPTDHIQAAAFALAQASKIE